ncbi:lycopene cyclase domain-containing protein [Aquiluna sp. Uisw_065]|uniref:lycopene cyclase domain-containing protein n=1 Tax=Aquiluna sp. Uisw_065 TaxID=3230967 RepID=UPI0039EC4439
MIDALTPFAYLAALVLSTVGLYLLDRRHKLAFATSPKAAALSITIAVALFLVWDLVGIGLGIFFRGDAPHLSGLLLAPELPLEELFFLIVLSYNSLLVYLGFARRLKK